MMSALDNLTVARTFHEAWTERDPDKGADVIADDCIFVDVPRNEIQRGPEPNADGSTTIYFNPKQPQSAERGNWIQTNPDKGWFTILRLYSPLQSFFDKSWRPSEIELVK
jgi:hypothetical protein